MEKRSTIGCSLQAICFDYYGTLVQAGREKPFALIDHWLQESVIGQKDPSFADGFVMAFAKERARLLYHSRRFFSGKQLLENCYLAVCYKYQIEPQKQRFIEYVKHVFSDTILYEDTKNVLDILKKKYIVGLVTNADNDILEASLRRHDLTFDFIITSEAAGCNKPEKKIFQKAFEILDIPTPQIAMVGDSLTEDIIPAKELEMFGIWMNKTDAVQVLYPDLLQISDIRELLQISNMKSLCCGHEGQK